MPQFYFDLAQMPQNIKIPYPRALNLPTRMPHY